jgi:NAD(P)-dependent dehydrogenase (short-subunit alcohol dehydrogenase family)
MSEARPRVAVLGASKEAGTGWVIAERLAGEGCAVTVGARTAGSLAALAAAIGGHGVCCDATREDEVAAFAAAAAAGGPLAAAILVAGEGVRGTIDAIPDAELERALRLNLVAPVYFLRHFARHLADGGGLVLMSSIAATNPWPGYFAYGAAKAGLQALVGYAALEYAPRRVRVNAVVPGPIRTSTASALFSNEHLRAALEREVPLGSTASTEAVAEAAIWLALRAASITGECLHVDGGMHLRRPPFPDELQAALEKSKTS